MAYNQSLVAITPADFKSTAEELGLAMGHSGNEFTVPLSADGLTVTHYGLHSWATIEAAQVWLGNAYPPVAGFNTDDVDAIRSQLIISVQEGASPGAHFDNVLTSNGLERFEPNIN